MFRPLTNFGGNLTFRPGGRAAPRSEEELLGLLAQARSQGIRVRGAGHSWSPLIVTDGLSVDLRHFRGIEVAPDRRRVRVGAGCRLKRLLRVLRRRGLTLPSLGLITEQTVAGAVATGTHGSGRHSLSHYVLSVRLAVYGPHPDDPPRMIDVDQPGPLLRATRCGLGALGVVTSLELPVVPRFGIREVLTRRQTLDQVLAMERTHPLQQFYLIPHRWDFVVQARRAVPLPRVRPAALLYRFYWLLALDLGLHLVIKTVAAVLRSPPAIRWAFRRLLLRFLVEDVEVTDASDRMLVMEHELFRHLEMELFVPEERLALALERVTEILQLADDASWQPSTPLEEAALRAGVEAPLRALGGTYTHHYPICVRRILPDETLLSMAAGAHVWYAISLITYVEPREPFFRLCAVLAPLLADELGARPHWGKWMPLDQDRIARLYPELPEFVRQCRRVDPTGTFANGFLRDVLGLGQAG
ncbi:MAG: FAD-binding protein [Gemmatimonadota bacterium]